MSSIISVPESDIHAFKDPYPHIIVDGFLSSGDYKNLCEEFDRRLALGIAEVRTERKFVRSAAKAPKSRENYEALINRFEAHAPYPVSIFYSREFWEFFQARFEAPLSRHMLGAFHHHSVGSKDGWVHCDFNSVLFKNKPAENGLIPFSEYEKSEPRDRPGEFSTVCRSLVVIYYMNNPEWEDGDGGGTGIFKKADDPLPVKTVDPVNNRLLAFEISPISFHGFRTNHRKVRNSVSFWFHSDFVHMAKKYGMNPRPIP